MKSQELRQRHTTLYCERDEVKDQMERELNRALAENREMRPDEKKKYSGLEARSDALLAEIREIERDSLWPGTRSNPALGDVDARSIGQWSGGYDDLKPGTWLGATLRDLSGASGLGAAVTPTEAANYVIDRLAPKSVALASGITVLRTDRDSLDIPHVTSDGTAAWTAENASIGTADIAAAVVTATPRKLAALQIASNEVIADANPAVLKVIEDRLTRALALKLDLGFFEGSGVAPEIEGLKNVSGIQTTSDGTNGFAVADLDQFAEAIGLLQTENADATAIAMHPRSWKALLKLKELTSGSNKALLQESAGSGSQGVQRSIYGVPVYLSSQLSITETMGTATTASSAYVYDASQIYAVARKDASIEIDRSRYFETDQTAIRCISRWDVVVPNPKAVVRIEGIIP